MEATCTENPVRENRDDGDGAWRAPGPVLAEHLVRQHRLDESSARIVRHGLRHVEAFYASGHSLSARRQRVPVSNSPVPVESARLLLRLAVEQRVERTLEVGFAFGMSTCHLLVAHEVVGGSEHVAIDPFQQSEWYQGCGLMNVVEAGLSERLEWLNQRSELALPELLRTNRSFDLCFVDGSHLFGDILVDAHYCQRMLREGGLLVLDDLWLPATRTVRSILLTNYGFSDESDPTAPNLAVLRKTGPGRLDWTRFADQFAPFSVG